MAPLAAAAPYIVGAGAAVSAFGSYKSGQAQASAGKYNAKLATQQAAQNEETVRNRLRKLLASQRALYAKAGVDLSSGSPVSVLAETAAEGERDALIVRYGGQAEAAQQKMYASSAKTAGIMGGIGTLLTGLGQAGGMYYQNRVIR